MRRNYLFNSVSYAAFDFCPAICPALRAALSRSITAETSDSGHADRVPILTGGGNSPSCTIRYTVARWQLPSLAQTSDSGSSDSLTPAHPTCYFRRLIC